MFQIVSRVVLEIAKDDRVVGFVAVAILLFGCGVGLLKIELQNLPSRQHHLQSDDIGMQTLVSGIIRSTGIGADGSTDATGTFGPQVKGNHRISLSGKVLPILQDPTRLSRQDSTYGIPTGDAVHSLHRQHHLRGGVFVVASVGGGGQGDASSDQTRVPRLWNHSQVVFMTILENTRHFFGVLRAKDNGGRSLVVFLACNSMDSGGKV